MNDQEQYELLSDVHKVLPLLPETEKHVLVKSSYKFYHYKCDGVDDVGWGCGYRTLQTLCSWIINAKQINSSPPDIRTIQKTLVDIGDKPSKFYGSREWIGAVEVSMVLNTLYDIDCKILHVPHGSELFNFTGKLYNHFQTYGSPIMMGGDEDNSSKGIMGIACCRGEEHLLVVDPHFVGKIVLSSSLLPSRWIRWEPVSKFHSGFYNLVLPMCEKFEKRTPCT
ncbi:hypothetical protein R5R35_010758 [Gryllus longicercus]|uniref:UFSP1/2/DUB catalytic domain-containing protein n=1 Tax=Gryllus longicercus TaxID=2509291 RepID=A0AAN9V2J7_9ORTH